MSDSPMKFKNVLRSGFTALGVVALALVTGCSPATDDANGQLEEPGTSTPSDGGTTAEFPLLQEMQERGHAVIGVLDSPPSSWVESNGEPTGYNIDIIKRLLAKYDVDVIEPFQSDFAGQVPGLQSNRMDISVAGMLITPERCEILAMSAATNVLVYDFLVEPGNPLDLQTVEDVKNAGAKLAVESATTQERIVREILDESQVVSVADRQGGADAVRVGRADAYVLPTTTAKQIVEAPGAPLEVAPDVEDIPKIGSTFALRIEDKDFADALRADFEEMIESGEYAEIMESYDADYSPRSLPGVQLTCD